MQRVARPLAFVVLASAALLAAGCGNNKEKIVGKWKLVSMTPKNGQEQKLEFMGMSPVMEFTADGNIKVGVDASTVPPAFKEMLEKSPDGAAKLNEMQHVGKYKVSGSSIEFVDMKKGEDSPLGSKNGGKLSFDGDNLTITGDDGTLKLTRAK
jgi:hypothetical protein